MPLFHCNECHHEWEGSKGDTTCGWCDSSSYILETETPLEKTCQDPQSFEELLERLVDQVGRR